MRSGWPPERARRQPLGRTRRSGSGADHRTMMAGTLAELLANSGPLAVLAPIDEAFAKITGPISIR